MERIINVKQLRASLPEMVDRVRRGERFTVIYRSRPAFRIVPVTDAPGAALPPLERDPFYRAAGVGRSSDGRAGKDHDKILYGAPARGRGKRRR